MDQSLRNHAMLVQHQNEQQQQQRQQRRAEEYYRHNHGMQIPLGGGGSGGGGGVVRGSSSSQASGSNKSSNKSRGSNSVSSGSKQSRTSGSGSGKSTRSGTRNSGTAGSDDAIGGIGGGGLGASLAAHHNRDHRQHRQQQQQSRRQQQQQYQQQYRQQLGTVPQHQQYQQQQYQQQEQHYDNNSQPQQEQYMQQQYLQEQYEQQQQHEQQQQQHEQQQQYELQQQYEQQQLQQQYEQQQQQESQHYHGSYSSQISQSQYSQSQSQYSQQSQSQQSYYIDYQSQGGGGGGGQAGGTVQSHYSSIYGSVTDGTSQAQQSQAQQSQASTARSAAVDEAYRRLGQKLSRSVHGDDISSASSARGQPHNRIHQQHPVRIGSVNNPSSVFVPYNKGAAIEQQEKEQRQKQQRATNEDDNGKGNVVRKLTANANDLFRLWHTEYQRTNPNTNTGNVKEQQQHQRRQPQSNQKQNHDHNHDVSPDRRAFAQMTLAGDGSSSSSNINNNNTIGDAHNNNNNNNSSHHHISSHNHSHNHNNHNSIYHQRRGSLSAVIESDSCTNKRSSSDSSNGRSRATNNTNINQRSTQSVGDGGRGDNDNSIIASSSIGTRASSIGTRTCNSSRSYNALPPPRGKCLTQPSEGISGTNYNLCDNTEGNLIVYKNDTLSVPRKQVHVLNNKTNSNGGDDGSKIRQRGSGASAYTDFRVRSLLGQGTFAQVFKCLNSQTGKYVAVKIVKAKPAYTRQAAIEIDVIRALTTSTSSSGNDGSSSNTDYMVDMVCYFMYKDHLCLVFELLGMNLYEVLKKRQFRGLPLGVVQTMVRQAVLGARALGQKSIVHCDLKPENILLVSDDDAESVMSAGESKRTAIQVEETGKSAAATTITGNSDGNDDASLSTITTTVMADQKIKLIDFGSACFEGQMSHTYIQSRFYRSPEVLIGLAYDSAIDMWSLGCVAAELFLGLPILPGVHEHNQLGRISEMIGDTPDWMLDQGSKTSKFFVKFVPAPTPTPTPPAPSATNPRSPSPIPPESRPGSQPPRPLPQWRIKTQQEYIASLSQKDIKKKGGLTKLEKQPGNRYFKRTRLSDIVLDKGQSGKQEDVRLLQYFVHFLYGILDPDPWKRWTASQVVNHPFLTGATMEANTGPIKDDNQANIMLNLYWEAPSDPTIYRRKLLNVQKTREKQQAARQHRSYSRNRSRSESPYSQDGLPTVRSVSSETLSVSSYSDEFTNQAAAGPQMRPGSYQMSAAAGPQSIMYGPQSYSEAGNLVNLPGSFAEVDFALALQRPGVVPTGPGDSVTTGSMTASTSATTMSSNNSRSTYHHTNLGSQSGSYGTHQVLHNGNHQQRRFPVATSRSFGEGDVTATSRVPAEIDSRHQQVVYASSHDSGIYIGPPPTELEAENIPNNLPLAMSTPPAPPAALGSTTQLPMQYTVPLNNSSAAVTSNNTGIQNPNMGNYDQQAYQQQLAMMQHQFQQQQILLQQQQAALALQQQQLEQYSMNQALMNPNIPNATAAGMNTGGAPAAVQGGGYYVVTADDGTSRLVAASNLGMAIPMSGQVAGIGAPGKIQGQGIATPNNQAIGDGFYTNNSNHQHQHPHQQP